MIEQTADIITALRILAKSDSEHDEIPSSTLLEAAERLERLQMENISMSNHLASFEDEVSMKYFTYCPDDGLDFHNTSKKAKQDAEDRIQSYLNDGWDDNVEFVFWGEVTEIATKTNVREIDENGCLPDGEDVGDDFSYYCEYELKPPQ